MIRFIRCEDAKAIRKICQAALQHDTTEELLARRITELSESDQYYLAVYENDSTGQVEGFIQAEKYNLLYGENGWNIIALAVNPEVQKNGIGRQLTASLEDHAGSLGYQFVRLNCNIIRTEAHRFYEAMGYCCDKTQKRFIKKIGDSKL